MLVSRKEILDVRCEGADGFKWSRITGVVSLQGQTAFFVSPQTGQIFGTPSEDQQICSHFGVSMCVLCFVFTPFYTVAFGIFWNCFHDKGLYLVFSLCEQILTQVVFII